MNRTIAMIAGVIVGFAGLAAWANGDLNPAFGTDGFVNIDFEGRATDALQAAREQANGSFLVAGRELRPRPDTGVEINTFGFIANLSTNGSVVGTPVAVNLASEFRDVSGVSVPADGAVFFSGTVGTPPALTGIKLVRTNAAGEVNGRYTRPGNAEDQFGFCRNPVREPNGKIAVSCVVRSRTSGQNIGILRLNSDFTEDTSFGPDGNRGTVAIPNLSVGGVSYLTQVAPSGNNNLVRDPADGSFYVMARALNSDFSRTLLVVAKFSATGVIVPAFGGSGVVIAAICTTSCAGVNASDIVLDSGSGTLLVTGVITKNSSAGFDYYVTRVNATTGALVAGFGSGGSVLIPGDAGRAQRPTAILPTSDGIYLLRQGSNLIRLQNATGAIDTGYTAFGTDIVPLNRRNANDLSRWFGMLGVDDGALLLGGVSQCAGVASNAECSTSGAGTTLSSQAIVAKFRFTADETPDGFSFNTLTDQPVSTLVTSTPTMLTGFTVPVPISVSGAAGSEYSIGCNDTFTSAAGTISSGQSVCVRHMTAATTSTTTMTRLTAGGVSADFIATTVAPIPDDTTPEQFMFEARTGVEQSTAFTSNSVTISGINAPSPISVSGGVDAGYSIGCTTTFTAEPGTISNGQTVCVRQTSAATPETATTTTLNVGGISAGFRVTTAVVVGPQPAVSLSSASLSFGSQAIGTSSGAQTLTLRNSGNAMLTITGLMASGDFTQSNGCPAMLSAGEQCDISVTFTPITGGNRSGGLSIMSNAPTSPDLVTLSGFGMDTLIATLNPASLAFDPLAVGGSASRFVTLSNSGTLPFTFTAAADGDFTVRTSGCDDLDVGASCTLTVSFAPTAVGDRSGTLTITTTDGGVLTADLSGRGLSSRVIPTAVGDITLTASQGIVESFVQVDTPAEALPQYNYALGFFSFRITGLPAAGLPAIVRVSFTLPDGVPFNTYVKCSGGQCVVPDGVEVNGNVLTITLTDNGAGDSDNDRGEILDPGAPAQSASTGGGSSSSGGGAMSGWLLALLALPALLRRRRRMW